MSTLNLSGTAIQHLAIRQNDTLYLKCTVKDDGVATAQTGNTFKLNVFVAPGTEPLFTVNGVLIEDDMKVYFTYESVDLAPGTYHYNITRTTDDGTLTPTEGNFTVI